MWWWKCPEPKVVQSTDLGREERVSEFRSLKFREVPEGVFGVDRSFFEVVLDLDGLR